VTSRTSRTSSTTIARRAAGLGTAALLTAAPLVVVAPVADAAGSLPCHASMSDSTPKDYTNVYVRVTTSSYAGVHTVAHYKTTNTGHTVRAGSTGHATVRYYISSATPGYRVRVDVTVSKNGHHGYCSTSFVPHR
jgi:hypothetical protein